MALVRMAPEWEVSQWFNTTNNRLALGDLRGRVVVLYAFALGCPGCMLHALPQAQRVAELFPENAVQVVGIHCDFTEERTVQPNDLQDLIAKQRFGFPIGMDRHDDASEVVPVTMRRYQMQGTPTVVLIDGNGVIQRQITGPHDDLMLGAEIGMLWRQLTIS